MTKKLRLHTRDIEQQLRLVGLRPTRQRMTLAKLLFDGVDKHVTAESLHAQTRGHKQSISLATVYNTLHQFTDAGLLRQVVVDVNGIYFDTNVTTHHHFYDTKRGHLTDIPVTAVKLQRLPPAPKGHEVERVDVIIRTK
jgi:Fur family transcriptional regulator, iron response regulator